MMNKRVSQYLASLATTSLLAFTAAPASAQSFIFSQSGFDGGGSLAGSFTGVDLDNNGWLDSAVPGEITAYTVTFSGDANVGAFSHGFDDLVGLVFRLNGDVFLGNDGPDGAGEQIGSWGNDNILYQSGTGLINSVTDWTSNAVSTTQQLVTVTAVPEPESYALMLFGLSLIALRARNRFPATRLEK